MVSRGEDSERSDELREPIASELEQCSDGQLHAIIDRAQELLHRRHDPTAELDARPGEEILRVDDEGDYTIVVVERQEESERGPYLYRVTYEPDVEGGQGQFRWWYLGRVAE